jgi:HAD superfamily hydrolase (TIGR01509 family)
VLAFDGWRPAAVVFDCDGLLVDTEPCWSVAEAQLFARRGLPFGPDEKAIVIGKSIPQACADMAILFNEPESALALASELFELVDAAVAVNALPMPGALATIQVVAARVPMAVASNSSRHLLDSALLCAGLAEFFEISVAADEVAQPKPAPDLYEAACAALEVAPSDCLAFEDSLTGLRSAKAAGLRTIGVPTLTHDDFPAEVVVASLEDEGLLRWIASW